MRSMTDMYTHIIPLSTQYIKDILYVSLALVSCWRVAVNCDLSCWLEVFIFVNELRNQNDSAKIEIQNM